MVEADIHVVLAAPLMHEGRLLGAIEVGSRQSVRPFSVADGDTLEMLAGSVASALVSLQHATALRTLTDTDPLTGLATQRKASDVLTRYLKLAQRRSSPVALVVVNVDQLNDVNAVHGREVGDGVVQRLGNLLTQAFRGEDVIARWDGEVFLIGMFDMRTDVAVTRLKDVQNKLDTTPFASATGQPVSPTFSAGIACFPDDGALLAGLTGAAEAALRQAKRLGRGSIVVSREDGLAPPVAA
jgi:diguanylate cyclase (GGDEF)-like protein